MFPFARCCKPWFSDDHVSQRLCISPLLFFALLQDKTTFRHWSTKPRMTFSPGFDRNNYRPFPFGAMASLAGTFTVDNRVVQLDHIGEPVDAIPVGHGLSDLAQHGAGRDLGDPQVLGCSKREDVAFVRSHEVDGPEPFDQGNLGGMKRGVGCC